MRAGEAGAAAELGARRLDAPVSLLGSVYSGPFTRIPSRVRLLTSSGRQALRRSLGEGAVSDEDLALLCRHYAAPGAIPGAGAGGFCYVKFMRDMASGGKDWLR